MIDKTVPEAVRFRSSDFSVTKELRCPVCGGHVQYRSWDAEHETFCFHCVYCGHDTKITWAAAAVLRAKGEVKFNANGAPIVPDDVTVPPLPEDPDNAAYEVWNIMKEITEPEEQQVEPVKYKVTITGTGCTIDGAAASNKQTDVTDGSNFVFVVAPTNTEVAIVKDSAVDFDNITVTVDGNTVSEENKRGLTWTLGTNAVTFTLANVKAAHTITVTVLDDAI
jgi:hypothetical protein